MHIFAVFAIAGKEKNDNFTEKALPKQGNQNDSEDRQGERSILSVFYCTRTAEPYDPLVVRRPNYPDRKQSNGNPPVPSHCLPPCFMQ
jgi:hypothetical protein